MSLRFKHGTLRPRLTTTAVTYQVKPQIKRANHRVITRAWGYRVQLTAPFLGDAYADPYDRMVGQRNPGRLVRYVNARLQIAYQLSRPWQYDGIPHAYRALRKATKQGWPPGVVSRWNAETWRRLGDTLTAYMLEQARIAGHYTVKPRPLSLVKNGTYGNGTGLDTTPSNAPRVGAAPSVGERRAIR